MTPGSRARRLLAGSARLLLVLVAVVAIGCQDDASRLAGHAERGAAYLEEEQWTEAVLEFRNMLKIDPNDAAAHWGLAQALLGQKDLRKAYWELQETTRLDPANTEAHLRYGQFLLFGGETEQLEAVERADTVIALEPENADALVLKGRALMALKREEEAGEALRRAVEAAPDKPRPILLLAEYERRQGRVDEAEALFERLISVEDRFAAHVAYAGFLASFGGLRDEEAEARYRHALTLAEGEEQATGYTLLANYLVTRGRNDEVEAVLRAGIDALDDDGALIYGLARFYHSRGEQEKADGMIQEAAAARPDDPEPLLFLSQYRGQNGDLEGALDAAEQALGVAPEDLRARLRKAEVLVDLGYRTRDTARVAAGRAVVDAVLTTDEGNPEALFVRSKIAIAEADLESAISDLRRVLDARPDWAQAHFLMGSALFLQGDRAGARAEVARALELEASFAPAARLMVRIHAGLGDHDLAVESGRAILKARPDDDETRIVLAQSLVRLARMDDALSELLAIPPERRGAEAEFAIGRTYSLTGDTESAYEHLMRANALQPHRYGILAALLDLDMKAGRPDASAERVSAALAERPDDPQLLQLHGQVSLYTGRTNEAESAFRKAIEANPNDLGAYQNLARYLAVTGRPTEVLETYERALGSNPESASLHLIVGSLYELQGKSEEAMERYESAIQLDPDLAVAKNNLAYLIADRGGNLDRALDLAQEAKAMLPDNPHAADTLGWVLYKKGVATAAISYLREAESGMPPQDPQLGIVRHHLALAYVEGGEPARAREVLERAIRDLEALYEGSERPEPPWAADLRTMLSELPETS